MTEATEWSAEDKASVEDDSAAFERLLLHLKEGRGFDFTGYKRPSLVRRVRHRMRAVGFDTYDAYQDYLEVNPDEFVPLFNTILVNVTSFFRDRESWEYLSSNIVPGLLEGSDHEIRVWSAGCASGQEAYSLAMMLTEAMGLEQFRDRVKIYATDIDEDALGYARAATYTEREMKSVPDDLRSKYFEPAQNGRVFRQDLRRSVIFGRNYLTTDAPISRIDLLTCRNTLMYFNAETQSRILSRLAFALKPSGTLLLGKAEMLLDHTDTFVPIDIKRRLFRRGTLAAVDPQLVPRPPAPAMRFAVADPLRSLRTDAFAAAPQAQLVIDAHGTLAMINESAKELTKLGETDVGRRFLDLDLSFRPIELRPALQESRKSRQPRRLRGVRWTHQSPPPYVDIDLVPLVDLGEGYAGTLVTFSDVTRYQQVHRELEQTTKQLQAASEELQSTNEELETTNEELQSTVEELRTTNEELQSTNEELETMNEELQSMNDELQGANEELRERSGQLADLNDFMDSILGSMRSAVIVLDRNFTVQVWNRNAQDLWGVRSDEAVGSHLLGLDCGLPTDAIAPCCAPHWAIHPRRGRSPWMRSTGAVGRCASASRWRPCFPGRSRPASCWSWTAKPRPSAGDPARVTQRERPSG
ncbi:CheR family methyltransferase [Terrabacter sp. BE26]|uniref:CheR family methyltransferase n=1 Tax=Terrabacter sp. BE26 TaxID=2898152 RepID=UPI0035BE2E85